jgi:hypothetical protein
VKCSTSKYCQTHPVAVDLPICGQYICTIIVTRYILDARELHVVTCLKKIMNQLMIRFVSKRKEIEDMCGTICPKIRKKLDKNIDFAVNYGASLNNYSR